MFEEEKGPGEEKKNVLISRPPATVSLICMLDLIKIIRHFLRNLQFPNSLLTFRDESVVPKVKVLTKLMGNEVTSKSNTSSSNNRSTPTSSVVIYPVFEMVST